MKLESPPQPVCPTCGLPISSDQEPLDDCCTQEWIRQQIAEHYA
ncbi:hypothetical protein [Polycladomyces abyssicola]|nr:hypothetical protein [Polycladomyces abyssicola]